MSMLQGAKSEMQCRRTRRAVHQLPAGRGGVYSHREQAEEVSYVPMLLTIKTIN
jgi:hypothetical protein